MGWRLTWIFTFHTSNGSAAAQQRFNSGDGLAFLSIFYLERGVHSHEAGGLVPLAACAARDVAQVKVAFII